MRGIRRTHGTAPSKKTAAVLTIIRDMVDELARTPGLRAIRDRALLLIGYGGVLRRSEVVALDLADVTVAPEQLALRIRRAKTDQQGARLSDRAVTLILKDRLGAVRAADGSPAYAPEDFSGHCLRSGWITTVARAGALDRNIARHSRHKSMAVLHVYIQAADPFGADNVSGMARL